MMKFVPSSIALVFALGASQLALAQATPAVSPPAVTALSTQSATTQFSRFVPQPARTNRLDYTVWDELLKDTVFYTGPSLRQRAGRPSPELGTRFVRGHTSPFRLEGNKVMFEGMTDEYKEVLDQYAEDLISIGNRVDVSTLPRNEQLAYWFNLHNVLVIQAIADEYPVSIPSRETGPDGLEFHDTKRVTLSGVPLSLRDIRENIVYPNWNDPLVIYGFFHGDIGSPSMQRKAFTGANVRDTLEFVGEEFANSLRGVQTNGRQARVSRHYEDAAPFYFPNFEADLRAHLASLMDPEVKEELDEATRPLAVASYEYHVADMTNGDHDRIVLGNVQTLGIFGFEDRSGIMSRALIEHGEKMNRIRERGLFGTVTIEDIQTPDPDAAFGEPGGPQTMQMGPLPGQSTTTDTDE